MTELEKCEIAKAKGFTYDFETGSVKGVKGNTVISKDARGYIICSICFDKKAYSLKSHRLAWYLHYGELPKNNIDHIDGDKANNKIDNLRDVTQQQNNWNRKRAKGYHWNKQRKKFQSYIVLNKKNIHLGMFVTEEEARNAYLEAKAKYHIID